MYVEGEGRKGSEVQEGEEKVRMWVETVKVCWWVYSVVFFFCFFFLMERGRGRDKEILVG